MYYGYTRLIFSTLKQQSELRSKLMSSFTKSEIRKKRNECFNNEAKKQKSSIGRVEKIEVTYETAEDEILLIMNKHLSTPHDCAMHIREGVANVSALAIVDGETWDMHKPLSSNCKLKLLSMKTPSDGAVNNAFWRTCSLILGAVADNVFKDDITSHLHSFPAPIIKSGSFVYDVFLDLPEWVPTNAELRSLSAAFINIVNKELPIERLETTPDVAHEIFKDNPFKSEQIPHIAQNNNNKIILYRIGDHIDISKGPMVGHTGLIGRCTISAIHKIKGSEIDNLYRFQGVAIPKGILLNHFAYNILENRAKKFNEVLWIPHRASDSDEDNVTVAANN